MDPVGGAGTQGPPLAETEAAVRPAAAPNAAAAEGYHGEGRGHPAGPFSMRSLSYTSEVAAECACCSFWAAKLRNTRFIEDTWVGERSTRMKHEQHHVCECECVYVCVTVSPKYTSTVCGRRIFNQMGKFDVTQSSRKLVKQNLVHLLFHW